MTDSVAGRDSHEACIAFLVNNRVEVKPAFRIASREIRKWSVKRGLLYAVV